MRAPAGLHIRNVEIEGVGPWMWRDADHWAWEHPRACFGPLRDLILDNSKGREVIIQAGGCMGMYPRLFADSFATVYTFEPDPINFYCLVANCPDARIIKLQAALSDQASTCSLTSSPPDNAGMCELEPEPGNTLTVRLDSFAFNRIDALQLDCEGHETRIIAGAINTLRQHSPTVAVERPDAELRDLLKDLNYREVGRIGGMPDVVFARH